MAWLRTGDNPLSVHTAVRLLTHSASISYHLTTSELLLRHNNFSASRKFGSYGLRVVTMLPVRGRQIIDYWLSKISYKNHVFDFNSNFPTELLFVVCDSEIESKK